MSQQNLITVNIPQEDVELINTALATLREKLMPHLKNLKPSDRVELPKMGDKTVAFVQKALEHCTQNPELAPQFLDVAEYKSDVAAVETLRGFNAQLTQINDAVSDTMLLSGSDAYSAALMFYNTVKTAKKSNVAKAGTIYEDLSERFPGRPLKTSKAAQ